MSGIIVICIFASCTSRPEQVESIVDRGKTPSLKALEVSTIISDSGVTRYRINTAEWLVYDKADVSYWDFPKGIRLEKFNTDLKTEAEIQSNYAIYYDKKKFWDLRDSVRAMNLEGERFECDRLFWDEKTERVYSDSKITIYQKDKIIKGEGFESNQSLTKYQIKKTSGIFPVSDTN